VTAEAVDFREASLNEIRMRQTVLEACDLTRAEVFRTKFDGMDLRGSRLDGILLSESMAELRGAQIEEAQAAALIRGLGILVR
jgi:uncharacterized protein YjbI with pentapeptide repeats